jgi:restriction endonuclease S subunit/type I restriction-modification system DNA methylase subunit
MLNSKTYSCGICNTTPDQISHHKSHIETQKHKDKKELFEFKLSKLTEEELEEKYNTSNVDEIVEEVETIIYNKKMKSNNSTEWTNITPEIMALKTAAIEESNSVSNREALKDKIHEIHNYLRNNGAGYGMNALKVFNILYGLKKIEEKGLFDVVNLKRPDCEFSYLLHLAEQNECEKLSELIFGDMLQSICDSKLKYILFYEIPQNIKGSVFAYLIKEINKITLIEKTCNVLLSGKIYEYFIGRDASAISELGAYFTNRPIVDYILQKLNPSVNEDGTISSMVDMFGGSGGFTTGYINYLNEQEQPVNWTTEINKISHFDMNEDVIKSAGLEIFCLTGVLPNMNNLKYKNSFADEFEGQKYKYILTNPPYGGDKNKKSGAQDKREKVKEFIKKELSNITDEALRITRQKQLKRIEAEEKQEKKESDKAKVSISTCSSRIQKFAKDNGLKGNDKESCSLMMFMDMLEIGGTAIGVLKEGVFFNKVFKDLRKCLIEKFNVREVISVPQDQFENTSTKTSIVIFDNSEEKTSEVIFSDLIVERYEEDKFGEVFGDIVIIENQGDIKKISDVLISQGSKEEILKNAICSLNGKDYGKKEILVGEGYELVKLGNITEINMGSTPSTKNYNYWDGNIPWVAISDLDNNIVYNTKKCLTECGAETMQNRKISPNSILLSFKLSIGKLGIAGREMYCNEAIAYLNSVNSNIPQMYLYYILESLNLEKYGRGTIGSSGNLNKEILKIIPIPIPTSQSKIQEWVDKISAPYNEKNAKQTQIKELEDFVQHRIKEIGENEECDEVEFKDVCITKKGKQLSKEHFKTGKYPVIGGGISPTGFHNEYNFEKNTILCSSSGNNAGYISKYNTQIWASDCFAIFSNCEGITNNFLYYILKSQQQNIFKLQNGSAQPHIYSGDLNKHIKIKIPKNKQVIQELEPTFQQIETLQHGVKVAEDLYKQLIQELSQESIPQEKKNVKEEPIEIAIIKEVVEEEKEDKKATKTKKTKKPKKEKEETKAETKAEPIKKKLKFRYITSPSDEELIDHVQPL